MIEPGLLGGGEVHGAVDAHGGVLGVEIGVDGEGAALDVGVAVDGADDGAGVHFTGRPGTSTVACRRQCLAPLDEGKNLPHCGQGEVVGELVELHADGILN